MPFSVDPGLPQGWPSGRQITRHARFLHREDGQARPHWCNIKLRRNLNNWEFLTRDPLTSMPIAPSGVAVVASEPPIGRAHHVYAGPSVGEHDLLHRCYYMLDIALSWTHDEISIQVVVGGAPNAADRVVRTVVCPSTLCRESSTAPVPDFTLSGALARSSSRSIKVNQNRPASSNSSVCVGPRVNIWNGMLSVTENTRLEETNLSCTPGSYFLPFAEGGAGATHRASMAKSNCLEGPDGPLPTNHSSSTGLTQI